MSQSNAILLGITLCFALSMQASFSKEIETHNAAPSEFYEKGSEAYKNKDYLTALKYLFAYRTLNEKKLSEHKEFSDQLNKSINISEEYILKAIQFRKDNLKQNPEAQKSFQGFGF